MPDVLTAKELDEIFALWQKANLSGDGPSSHLVSFAREMDTYLPRLLATIDQLAAALAPFGAWIQWFDPHCAALGRTLADGDNLLGGDNPLTLGDCRRAAALLQRLKGTP